MWTKPSQFKLAVNATAKDDFDQGPNYIILDQCNKFEEYVQGVPEKMHFQNATERPRDKNGPTDPRAHSEIPIIMTTAGFWPEDAL